MLKWLRICQKHRTKQNIWVLKQTSALRVQKTSHFLREETISSFALLHIIHVTSCSKMLINFLPHKFCCLVAQLCLLLWIPWTVAHQTSLSFTISQSLFKLMTIMPSNYLLLCCPLLHLTSIFLRKPIIFTHLCQIFWYILFI